MSKRERLSWKTRKQSKQPKTAGSNWYERTADPYTMNQERTHVPVEDYMIGDPSAWAEDPVEDLSRMDGTERNEIGMPAMDPASWAHKGEDAWGADGNAPYDNDDTFGPGDVLEREARTVRQAKMRLAKMQRHFEKKALQCVRIAQALLPNANEDVIAQQALDFMPLPDDAIIETNLRLEDLGIMAEEHEEDEEHEEGKEASSLSTDEMLRIMEAEEKEKEDGDHDEGEKEEGKEASIRALIAEEIAKAVGKVAKDDAEEDAEEAEEDEAKEAAEEEGEEEEAEEEGEEEEAEEEGEEEAEEADDEEEEKEAKGKKAALDIRQLVAEELAKALGTPHANAPVEAGDDVEEELLDEDLDAMLAEMEVGEDVVEDHAEMGIELEPQLDAFDTADLLDEGDDTLQALMNQSYGVEAQQGKQASSKKKVNQLGRVKEAGTTDGGTSLEGLWESAPDVSKVFS